MITFTYTKPNGEVSHRRGLVVQKPTDNYSILDLSEFDEEEIETYKTALEEYHNEMRILRKDLGLDEVWKNFKADRMTDIQK